MPNSGSKEAANDFDVAIAQKPYTAPWDPSLRPSTAFLPLDAGPTADNSTGNQPSQVCNLRAWQLPRSRQRAAAAWLAACTYILANPWASLCFMSPLLHRGVQSCILPETGEEKNVYSRLHGWYRGV